MKRFFEVLVEGGSDIPALREILIRKFGLEEKTHFRIHPHKGRGKLPDNPLARTDPRHQTLLGQLPAKLRGFSHLGDELCVIVVADVDDTPHLELLTELETMLESLPQRPRKVLFGLAIEETESWFIADTAAVLKAYPKAKLQRLREMQPDAIVGAWEALADAIGIKRKEIKEITGADKYAWAQKIAAHLDLDNPPSPSLKKLIDGISALI